ncbi:MAG: class I SAM-dependent methyltransferase [Caldilineaceae bacterium]
MDEISSYNQERWRDLAEVNALFTRPALDLDLESARNKVDPENRFGDLGGKRVLCLASGGGQQSVAFALLGADVTVVDLSAEQLERDRQAAAHYGLTLQIVQADMRDLSALPASSFDLVWQPYSINFVPEVRTVFAQVARCLRPGATYYFACANPLTLGVGAQDWDGQGYPLRFPYIAGAKLFSKDADWVHDTDRHIDPPQEFRHTLGDLFNGLVEHHFVLTHFSDTKDYYPDPAAEPGTWDHFTAVAPPWFCFWTQYQP